MQVSYKNEIKSREDKMRRDLDKQLDDEKQAYELEKDELRRKIIKLNMKIQGLQHTMKVNSQLEQKKSEFVNGQIAYLGIQFVKTDCLTKNSNGPYAQRSFVPR